MSRLKDIYAGLAITLLIAIMSYLISSLHPSFDLLVVSIIFGMLASNIFADRAVLEPGINWAIKVFLPVGIGLYGMQLSFASVGLKLWPLVAVVFLFLFFSTYLIAKGFGLDRDLALLLSTGMSICGASAIVVVAPLLRSKKEDTSISLVSIMAVGITGMLIYKFLPHLVGLSVEKFAFLSGTTLPMFGQVKIAAGSMGTESLLLASNFKLLRISFLIFIAGGILIFTGRQKKKFYIPWFMVLFFVLALAVNVSEEVAALRRLAEPVSKFSLSTALAAIGLSIDIDSITEKGAKPLFAVFLSWGITVLLLYLIMDIVNV